MDRLSSRIPFMTSRRACPYACSCLPLVSRRAAAMRLPLSTSAARHFAEARAAALSRQ